MVRRMHTTATATMATVTTTITNHHLVAVVAQQ